MNLGRATAGPDGPLEAEILLVGGAPGEAEIAQQRLFVDAPGVLLQECVKEAGIAWFELRRTTAVSYRPAGDKSTRADLDAERPRVEAEIAMMPNLKIVVLLGNDAMKQMMRKSGIVSKRGEEFTLDGVRYIPSFHPLYVLNRRSARPTLVTDLVRAKRLASGEPFLDPAQDVIFVPASALVNDQPLSWASGTRVAVDVETDEFDKPRLLAMGTIPSYVHVFDATAAKRQVIWNTADAWLGHNLRADEVWLRHLGVNLSGQKEDTMLMAHLLNENRSMGLKKLGLELLDPRLYWQYVEPLLHRPDLRGAIPYNELGIYCANDVATTLLLYHALAPQLAAEPRLTGIYRHMSLPLSDVLLEMEWYGVNFDKHQATRLRGRYTTDRAVIESAMNHVLNGLGVSGMNYGSATQVRHVLYNVLGLPIPHKTETGQGSTDEKALMALRDKHPFVQLLRQYRRVDKKDQIVESWMSRADAAGIVRPRYNQASVTTGRLSGSDPNAQNVPTDKEIRALITAGPGRSIISADYKTIEMGCAAWIFEEPTLLDAYRTQMEGGEDLHTRTARMLLGRPPLDSGERKKYGKTPNFGLLYQQGDFGFREYAAKMGVEMSLEEAAHMRAAWHTMYPGVRDGWRRIGNQMSSNGTLTAPSGRTRRLPEFLSNVKKLVNEAWRQGCNFPVQCTAAELTHVAAILAHRASSMLDARLRLHVHDSLVFDVPSKIAHQWAHVLKVIMEDEVPRYFEQHFGVTIPIPLRVDIGVGPNWGDLTAV